MEGQKKWECCAQMSYCDRPMSSVCPSLQGKRCEVRASVHLVSMGLHSVHLVGMGLGISGVKKSTLRVALNKEQFDPTSSFHKNIHPSVHPSILNN